MPQSGYTPIQHYKSTTSGNVPLAADLNPGELGINIADNDMSVYLENASGVVKRLINNPAGLKYPTADGTAGQVVQTDASGTLSFGSVQATLVSGTNIKTINNTSLLGGGNVAINEYTDADALTLFNASGSAPVYACRAWVNFNGTGTVAIRASGNVSSITDNGTGDYIVNFTTSMPDANISAIASTNNVSVNTNFGVNVNSPTASSVKLFCVENGVVCDKDFVFVSIFR